MGNGPLSPPNYNDNRSWAVLGNQDAHLGNEDANMKPTTRIDVHSGEQSQIDYMGDIRDVDRDCDTFYVHPVILAPRRSLAYCRIDLLSS